MGREKKYKKKKYLGLYIEQVHYDWIEKMALRMSEKEGRFIKMSEAARMALEAVYPLPKDDQKSFEF